MRAREPPVSVPLGLKSSPSSVMLREATSRAEGEPLGDGGVLGSRARDYANELGGGDAARGS